MGKKGSEDTGNVKPTLSVAYMVRDDEFFLKMSLEQAEKIADEIVICVDTRSSQDFKDYTKDNLLAKEKYKMFYYEHGTMAGHKQEVLNNCTKDWVLFIDSDEVLSDNCDIILEHIKALDKEGYDAISLLGHHFINNFATEDSAFWPHYWTHRLIKRVPHIKIEGTEHPMVTGYKKGDVGIKDVHIFHLGYVRHLERIKQKYDKDMKDPQLASHTSAYMKDWLYQHMLGFYPTRPYNFNVPIPTPIIKGFGIEEYMDVAYFKDRRNLETKHFIDSLHWRDHFKPKKAAFIGCGFGQRPFTLRTYGVYCVGYEISKYAVENSPFNVKLYQQDIINPVEFGNDYDLVVAYDLLEHLEEKDIDKAIDNIYVLGEDFVFSICFEGDKNYPLDPTHKICKPRQWWEDKLKSHGFKIMPTIKLINFLLSYLSHLTSKIRVIMKFL